MLKYASHVEILLFFLKERKKKKRNTENTEMIFAGKKICDREICTYLKS